MKKVITSITAVITIFVLGLILAGCGGDTEKKEFIPEIGIIEEVSLDVKSISDISKAHYAIEANKLMLDCRDGGKEYADYLSDLGKFEFKNGSAHYIMDAHMPLSSKETEIIISGNKNEKVVYDSEKNELSIWRFGTYEKYSLPEKTEYLGKSKIFGFLFKTHSGDLIAAMHSSEANEITKSLLLSDGKRDLIKYQRYRVWTLQTGIEEVIDLNFEYNEKTGPLVLSKNNKVYILTPISSQTEGKELRLEADAKKLDRELVSNAS